ncbi:hypothetical protein ACIGXF_06885 [Streptomyces sp. NPDC053086]|uniref:hypothetical protein n=1 Tax=unclassified Streptomyces TaxID=2593676 RepID=UPI0037D53C9E
MARLSFEKKRARQPVGHPAVHVRVFATGSASVGGTPVVAAPGEDIQQAVLNHLQRLAISLGAPIRATVQDDLAGCVVPLEVAADGSSRMTGEPVAMTAPETPGAPAQVVAQGTAQAPTGQFGPPPMMDAAVTNPDTQATTPDTQTTTPDTQARGASTQARGASARIAHTDAPAVGTGVPAAADTRLPAETVAPAAIPTAARAAVPAPARAAVPAPAEAVTPTPPEVVTALRSEIVTAPTHTPARGFDAVAEEVLGDGPLTETAEGAELLGEPMSRINEAVRAGRVEAAAELADRTLTEASAVFGPHHAEVLHLRELSAYIAYLGDDPVRACRLSVDVARLRRQAGDGDAAYGNVRSAATAWRAVRDPEEGLRLGRDLIDLWTDLTTEPGPAADDVRPLESARARMVRLTDRAAKAAQA